MKKVSKFTLCGIIAVLAFLLVIQGLVIHSKQKEIETAKLEYSVSKEMYDDLENDYDRLNEDYNDLREKCTNLVNSTKPENTKPVSTDNEQLPAEPVAPSSQESEVNNDTAPKQLATYDEATNLPWTQILISGEGTYRLENNSIVKYSNDETNDILYLIASSVPYDFSNKELKDNVGVYLYSIPDRSKSEIKFISQINYTETGNDYIFDESTNPVIKDCLYMEGIMEIEFDWWCTFADGYIHTRAAFPEGTFTRPVTTTPSVALSAYKG